MKGQIKKRGKTYTIIVDTYNEKGERKPKWIGGYRTKRDAENDLPKILSEVQTGIYVSDKIEFKEFADKWLSHVKTRVKESTYLTYVWAMDKLKERFTNIRIDKIKPLAIQGYLDGQPLSSTSIRYQYSVLTMAFNQAKQWNLLSINPCDNVTPPSNNKKKFNPYTDDQIKALIKGSKSTSIYIPVLLSISCGFRRGEVCGLNWSDIDFEKNMIYVRDGKTDNSARAVTAPPYIMDELKNYRGIGSVVNLKPDYVYKAFVKLITALKLPEITFHDLRHLHCSILIKSGVPLIDVSARVGHSSKSFTLNTYGHLLPTTTDKSSSVMNEFLSDSKPIAKKKKASK